MQSDNFKDKCLPLHSFDWDKAKIFYHIAKLGSFSETAKFLNASQPNLSRQISLLEEELQCRLFNRSVRGVILTRKGEELFAIVENYYLALKSFNYNHKVMSHDGERRKIRLCASHMMIAYVLRDCILDYNQKHPEIMIEIVIEENSVDLALNDIDVAIRPHDPHAKHLYQEHIITLTQKLYASQSYIEKMTEPTNTEDLRRHHFLAYAYSDKVPSSAQSTWILQLGMMAGGMHEPIISSNSLELLVESAKRGFGIISSYSEISLIKQSGLQAILPDVIGPVISQHIVYPNYLRKDTVFMNFVHYLMTMTQNLS